MKVYVKTAIAYRLVATVKEWVCRLAGFHGSYTSKDGVNFIELPNEATAGAAEVCKTCKHQFSCIAGNVQALKEEDIYV